ncbi:TolB family protein [Caulobacter segnis]
MDAVGRLARRQDDPIQPAGRHPTRSTPGARTARPVLTGQAFETAPVYSPDGKSIAFVSDRSGVTNLWVANADGTNPRQISREDKLTVFATPAWAPDGSALYVSRMKHPVLGLRSSGASAVDGAPRSKVVVKAQPNGEDWDNRINALGAVISSDGRYAYYAKKLGHTWTEKATAKLVDRSPRSYDRRRGRDHPGPGRRDEARPCRMTASSSSMPAAGETRTVCACGT